MKPMLACGLYLFMATPIHAEVCDKIRPHWNPSDGKVGQFQELYYFLFTEPIGIVLLLLSVCAIYLRNLSFSVMILLLLFITASLKSDWIWPSDEADRLAVLEGCTATPNVTAFVLILLGLIVILRGRTGNSQARTQKSG